MQADIVHLLNSATPIHYSFAAVAACLLIAGFVLMCCGTYFKFPKALEFLTKCCSNRCFVRRHTLACISNLHQRKMFRQDAAAHNAFRDYQQGTPSDQNQGDIDLSIPLVDRPPSAPTRLDTGAPACPAPRTPRTHPRRDNTSTQKQHFPDQTPDQVSTQHYDDQYGWQRLTNVPQDGRATSAPPPYTPQNTPGIRDNLDCANDVPNCQCIHDPTNVTLCMRDMVEVPM